MKKTETKLSEIAVLNKPVTIKKSTRPVIKIEWILPMVSHSLSKVSKLQKKENTLTDLAQQWKRHSDTNLTQKQSDYWDNVSGQWMARQSSDNATGRKWDDEATYYESEQDYQCHYNKGKHRATADEYVTMGVPTTGYDDNDWDDHDIVMDPMELEYLGKLFNSTELTGDVVLKCFTVGELLDQLESTMLRQAVLDVKGIARKIATKSQNELLDMIEQTSQLGKIDTGAIAELSGTGIRNVQKKVKMLKGKLDNKISNYI